MTTLAYGVGVLGVGAAVFSGKSRAFAAPDGKFPVMLTSAEWKKKLTSSQYYILREEGTERAFTSPLNDQHGKGVFACAGCSQKAFRSETKFDSGTGWPSFYEPIQGAVGESRDSTLGFVRTEVHCALRWSPRPCLRRRPEADRPALLHEWRGNEVRSWRRRRVRRDIMSDFRIPLFTLAAAGLAIGATMLPPRSASAEDMKVVPAPKVDQPAASGDKSTETAVFAGGCFWGVQGVFQHVKGVSAASAATPAVPRTRRTTRPSATAIPGMPSRSR